MSTLNERLKTCRLSKNLTQEDFAKILGTNRATLANWETGRTQPDNEMLIKIASYFNVTTDYLLGNDDSTNRPTPPQEPKKPKDLKKFLEQSEVMFDGETYKLDEEDKQKLRDALEFAFWHAKQKNKRKKS